MILNVTLERGEIEKDRDPVKDFGVRGLIIH